jgi:hypothetical protein
MDKLNLQIDQLTPFPPLSGLVSRRCWLRCVITLVAEKALGSAQPWNLVEEALEQTGKDARSVHCCRGLAHSRVISNEKSCI